MNKPLTNLQARDLDSVIHPYSPLHKLKRYGPLTIFGEGKGVFVYDSQGKEYIEGMAGLWCTWLGFGDDGAVEAATEQLRRLPYYHSCSPAKATEPASAACRKAERAGPDAGIDKVFFTSSGSEANDTQIKLVWYYNNAMGRPEKKKIIARVKAYHGVTIARHR